MDKDGTNRGGHPRAGAKPDALNDKLAKGAPASRLHDSLEEAFDFTGCDVGEGPVLAGEVMPEPSEYLSEVQRDGKPLGADLVYRETWQRLDQRGCSQFVAHRLIEAYVQAFARNVQCEQAISKLGLLGKQAIRSVGARVHYIEGISPTDSPDSVLMEGVADAFAEYYSLQLSANIRRGQSYNAERALSNGHKVSASLSTPTSVTSQALRPRPSSHRFSTTTPTAPRCKRSPTGSTLKECAPLAGTGSRRRVSTRYSRTVPTSENIPTARTSPQKGCPAWSTTTPSTRSSA